MKSYCWLFLLPLISSCSIFDANESSKIELDRSWELVEFADSSGEAVQLIDHETNVLRFTTNMELRGGRQPVIYLEENTGPKRVMIC